MEEKKEEKKEQEVVEQTQPSMLEQARDTVRELTDQNEIMRKQIQELEKLRTFEVLGGKSEIEKKEEKPPITDAEYAKMALQGKLPEE